MRLWIDNTGLQSAAQCLDGRASLDHDYDIRGLFQLATLLIYGNRLSLNGFEDDKVARRSEEIVQQLRSLGIDDDTLSIREVTEPEYALACKTAADSIALDLCDSFNPEEHLMLGTEPPELPRGAQERLVNYIRLAMEPNGSAELRKTEDKALDDRAIGAVDYMLACSEPLRHAVKRALTMYPGWGNVHTYQLNVFLRYHLNEALGEQSFSRYAPAVGRGELVQRRSDYLLDVLGQVVDRAADSVRGEPLGIPSTLACLLQRSKGEPRSVLQVALELRARSRPLRDALEVLATRYPVDTPESRFEIQRTVKELGQQLRKDVGLEKPARLRDAVELRFVFGVPVAHISGMKVLDWIEERRRSRRTAVLTELVKASAYADLTGTLIDKLRARATRHRNSS
jgi:hypothetical protein